MRILYRTFEIHVWREKCMAGYALLYYSIFRSDGFELDSGYMDTGDTVRFMLSEFKKRVDAYIAHPSATTASYGKAGCDGSLLVSTDTSSGKTEMEVGR